MREDNILPYKCMLIFLRRGGFNIRPILFIDYSRADIESAPTNFVFQLCTLHSSLCISSPLHSALLTLHFIFTSPPFLKIIKN